MRHTTYLIIAVVIIAIIVAGSYAYLHSSSKPRKETKKLSSSITVCNAGSLTIPLQEVASSFEKKYGIDVLLEPSGSVKAVRKVTDFGVNCDVVAVADYKLIPRFMVPKYARWYIAFATNSMVILYTNHSKYANVVSELKNPLNIFKILTWKGVRYGFSNPNIDPCGYTSVGVIGLAALETHNLSILKSLVIDKIPGSSYKIINGTLNIYIPANIEPRGNLVIRPKEVDLVSVLENGDIDYAFNYLSIALQHHLNYVKLPPSISLADPEMAQEYARVVVHILVGTKDEKAIKMAPIVYGITVPITAKHKEAAILFVKYLLKNGREIFEEKGQPFLPKPLGYGEVPRELISLVKTVKPTKS